MQLVIAGAGAAGTALARALSQRGWSVGAVACRTAGRARERCALIGAGQPVDLATLARAAGAERDPVLLLVTVPDRAIAEVAGALARRPWPAGSVALHISGSVEIEALQPLATAGLATGGMHPLKSFVDPARDAETLAGTVLALEGSEAALELGERIARDLDALPFRLTPGSRAAWHAGATHAANHLVALVDQALDLMSVAGLTREAARSALLPLLRSTVDNLAHHAPGRALTGPVVRGDVTAVERHMHALRPLAPDLAASYRALAARALHLARTERGLDPELAGRIANLLEARP